MTNLIGKKFGLLTVDSLVDARERCNKAVKWHCICECGKKVDVFYYNLTRGNTKSCGCLSSTGNRGNKNKTWKGHGEISASKWYGIERAAKRRNVPFLITIQDAWDLFLKQNRLCALSGELLTMPSHSRDYDYTASLDRVDNQKGYELHNIQWVHREVNYMKSTLTQSSFIDFCKKVANHNS